MYVIKNNDGTLTEIQNDLPSLQLDDFIVLNGQKYFVESREFDADSNLFRIYIKKMPSFENLKNGTQQNIPMKTAREFKNMSVDEKAVFFENLHKMYFRSKDDLSDEINKISISPHHTLNGKWVMHEIGQRFQG